MKIKILFLLGCALMLSSQLNAQLQNNQWRFGNGSGINFNTTPPGFTAGAALATFEGSASIADRNTGNLLFYTDGVTVWGANNLPMPNGSGLIGGMPGMLSSTTAGVIAPFPANPNRYYLFSIDEQGSGNGIYYHVIDMTLNGGLGDIVAGLKNIPLFVTDSEKLQLIPNRTATGYWLLTHNLPGNTFYAFAVTAAGVSTTPVISTLGAVHTLGVGHMKVNRQFNKVAMGNDQSGQIELFDFDNATGQLSNFISWSPAAPQLGGVNVFYGVEFSPDGSKLYISNITSLVQYNISSGVGSSIAASAFIVTSTLPHSGQAATLQLGPDQRIYFNNGNIDVINCPNATGATVGYQANLFSTLGLNGGYGLPSWVFLNTDLPAPTGGNSIVFRDSCIETGSFFSLVDTSQITTVLWNFGDPASGANNTATGFSATHTFSAPGSFIVTATLNTPCGNSILTLNVTTIRCSSRPTNIRLLGDSCDINNPLGFELIGNSLSTSFFWRFGDPASGTDDTLTTFAGNGNSVFHQFSGPGTYEVCVRFQEPGEALDSLCLNFQFGLCCSFEMALDADCIEQIVEPRILGNATIDSIQWDFGVPGRNDNAPIGFNPLFQYAEAGNYLVQARVFSACGVDTLSQEIQLRNCEDKACKLLAPNVFTPNSDGLNDLFLTISSCVFESYDLSVFNRWGQEVFRTTDPTRGWNGFYQGHPAESGQYLYVLFYRFKPGSLQQAAGPVSLIR